MDDVEIAFHEWGPATGRPVLLHHGFVADAIINWEGPGIVAGLLERGHRVVGIDARGHGASGKPHDLARYGEVRMAQDLDALVDLLGFDSYDLVGYSMGAVVSLIQATGDSRIRRLVIGGVGAGVVEVGGVDTRALDVEVLAHALSVDDPADISEPAAAGFRAFADLVGADRAALAAQVRSAHSSGIALDRIHAPTLVLAGDIDPLAVRPEVLTAAIPDARLEVHPGDHLTVLRCSAFQDAIFHHLAD